MSFIPGLTVIEWEAVKTYTRWVCYSFHASFLWVESRESFFILFVGLFSCWQSCLSTVLAVTGRVISAWLTMLKQDKKSAVFFQQSSLSCACLINYRTLIVNFIKRLTVHGLFIVFCHCHLGMESFSHCFVTSVLIAYFCLTDDVAVFMMMFLRICETEKAMIMFLEH